MSRPVRLVGRGADSNPPSRFDRIRHEHEPLPLDPDDEPPRLVTEWIADRTRSIIATNESPDVGFDASLNPYRGCEHGCIYCYARPTHEYLGYSAGLDFESRILAKPDAPTLLRRALESRSWVPRPLALSGVTDPYQPLERELQITRRCLEVLVEFRNPVGIVTKSQLITRDIDLLARLAEHRAVIVFLSITTLDPRLARALEPRASLPRQRLAAMADLARAGIPTGLMLAPVIPGLTDSEIPAIVAAAAQAGATCAHSVLLRLPGAVAGLFEDWLDRHLPARKPRVLQRLRAMRGGALNDPRFGHRMRGDGPIAEAIATMFRVACLRAGLNQRSPTLSTLAFRRPGVETQGTLFEVD
ncbi:MAG: radical SAM protein [Isosphaeraceae bacterium]|jgi:DNA repair photolyase|nr:MAG: radical SAM protein [Isosphaeraceae bacterium]